MKRLSDVLAETPEVRDLVRSFRAMRALDRWPEAVGERLAAHTKPEMFREGTIIVAASGSAWAQELRMQSEPILQALNGFASEDRLFRALRVSIRPLEPPRA